MNPISLLNWMLLSTVLLGVWWLCYRLALRSERSFVYNRVFLVLGPVLAASLPLLPMGWPTSWVTEAGALPGVASVLLPTVVVGAEATGEAAGIDWLFWTMAVYLSGALFMLVQLGWGLGRLWLSTRHLAREQCAGYTLVHTHGGLPTSSFGKAVFWDETLPLSAAEASQVLRHELAHVQQGHTYDRLLLELLRAALWFNPFMHLSGRALALTHEFLADEAALHGATLANSPASYTHLLARQVATRLGFSIPLAHSFSHSQTLRRIAMIHRTSPIRRWKQWLALPLVALCLFTVACERAGQTVAPATSTASASTNEATLAPPPPPIPIAEKDLKSGPDKVYTYVEQMPQLPGGGGNTAIVQYIQQQLVYPSVATANRKEGRVFVSFVVTNEGKVQDARIIKGLAKEYDAAVVAAVQQLPKFIPGMQDGKAVGVSFTVPITFAR